jgi:hypothetical protein
LFEKFLVECGHQVLRSFLSALIDENVIDGLPPQVPLQSNEENDQEEES